jgi:hypothetical protein
MPRGKAKIKKQQRKPKFRGKLQVHPDIGRLAHVDTLFICEFHFSDLTDDEFAQMAEAVGNMFRNRLIMINVNTVTVQKLRFSEITEMVTSIPTEIHKKVISGSVSRQLIVDEMLPYRSARQITGVETVRQGV